MEWPINATITLVVYDTNLISPTSSYLLLKYQNMAENYWQSSTAENYRQAVDQWAARNRDITVSFSFTEEGPEHDRRYKCTYVLGGTTTRTGEWKRNKPDAKESAATLALFVLRIWRPTYVDHLINPLVLTSFL